MAERKKRPPGAHDHDYALHVENRKKGGKHCTHNTNNNNEAADNEEITTNRLTARALYDTEDEEEEQMDSDLWASGNDSDSSVYSDWMGDQETNLQPPKRHSTRTRKRKRLTSTEDNDDEEDQNDKDDDDDDDHDGDDNRRQNHLREHIVKKIKPPATKKRRKTTRKPVIDQSIQEVPEEFRPPEWLTDTVPRKTPYVPQMGDEVMYFRQGHEQYLKAVKRTDAYQINIDKNQPWHKSPNLREQELVRIIGIHYEIRPPRLCCLRLAIIDPESGRAIGHKFSIKYHDIPDVIDFVVLRQNYETAMSRDFKPGDRFRSIIDDMWWLGTIISQEPFQPEFPDSMYQCFNVLQWKTYGEVDSGFVSSSAFLPSRTSGAQLGSVLTRQGLTAFTKWDNRETEKLSPWDMELLGDYNSQRENGEGFSVLPEEMKALLYAPKPNEWPEEGRDAECDRIIQGLELIMDHRIAEYFNAPVDLSAFPTYAIVIEYPIDLSTIKARLENKFYRRVNAIQYDVRYLETNALKFNQPNSLIVKFAKILSDAILRLISDPTCRDPMPILSQLLQGDSSDTEDSDTNKRKRANNKCGKRDDDTNDPYSWIEDCRQLISTIFQCEDSGPFREPISIINFPDYFDKIETPMDFNLVRDNLNTNEYSNPSDLCKDVHLIFRNSKIYNTNKRSRIYSMTVRLSAMFEEKIKEIQTKWKAARGKGGSRVKSHQFEACSSGQSTSQTLNENSSQLSTTSRTRRTTREKSRASTIREQGSSNTNVHVNGVSPMFRSVRSVRSFIMSDEDDDEADVENIRNKKIRKNPPRTGKSSLTNCNGSAQSSYKTRASTGSLKPKIYDSSDSNHYNDTDFVVDPCALNTTMTTTTTATTNSSGSGSESSSLSSSSSVDKSNSESASGVETNVRQTRRAVKNSLKSDNEDDNREDDNYSPKARKSKRLTVHKKYNDVSGSESDRDLPSRSTKSSTKTKYESDGECSYSDMEDFSQTNRKLKVIDSDDTESYSDYEEPSAKSNMKPSSSAKNVKKSTNGKKSIQNKSKSKKKSSSGKSRTTRFQGERTVQYPNESNEDDSVSDNSEEDDNMPSMSLSSRGRLRKPSARARATLY